MNRRWIRMKGQGATPLIKTAPLPDLSCILFDQFADRFPLGLGQIELEQ
jgi:hypothetical protein